MVIQNYGGFNRMTAFCKSRVPAAVRSAMELVKEDEAEVKKMGVKLGTAMCKELLEGGVCALHFYCLNLEKSTYGIMQELGMLKGVAEMAQTAAAASTITAGMD
jgi:methylenetetrahydrofolate reductase (NADPH)